MRIEIERGEFKYFDKYGNEIHEGDFVIMNGIKERVYRTNNDRLGTDATNPTWIETGRAFPCEYGIYPFTRFDDVELVIEL